MILMRRKWRWFSTYYFCDLAQITSLRLILFICEMGKKKTYCVVWLAMTKVLVLNVEKDWRLLSIASLAIAWRLNRMEEDDKGKLEIVMVLDQSLLVTVGITCER